MWLDWEESAGSECFVHTARSDFVPVVFAQDQTEADRYRGLLEAVGIPAVVERAGGEAELCLAAGGIVLLRVPEHLHDTASEIVASAQRRPWGGIEDDFDGDEIEDDEFDVDDDEFDDLDDDDLDGPD